MPSLTHKHFSHEVSSIFTIFYTLLRPSAAVNQYERIEDISKKVESPMHGTSLLDKIFSGFLIFVKIYEGDKPKN